MKKLAIRIVALTALMSPAFAASEASIERGKELFNSTRLGSNQRSCASCHPDGKNLAKAGAYGDKKLTRIVNQCIQNALAGDPLAGDSADMASLLMYVRTFAVAGDKTKR